MTTIVTTIQVRRGSSAEWASANPVLAEGEWGLDTDLGQVKIGNGAGAWAALAFFKGEQGEPGLSYTTFEYMWESVTFPPPGSGYMRFNNTMHDLTTAIYVHDISDLGKDNSNAFTLVDTGTRVFVQDKDEADKWVSFDATGPGVDGGGYWTFPVAFRDWGPVPLGNKKLALLNFATKGQPGEPGPPGPPGPWTQITQAAYNALTPPDPAVLYVVIG